MNELEQAFPFRTNVEIKGTSIDVWSNMEIPEEEIMAYAERGYKDFRKYFTTMYLKFDNSGYVDISYKYENAPGFDRIRRITGYLVGTLDRFNDAKRAEESERVKHATRTNRV